MNVRLGEGKVVGSDGDVRIERQCSALDDLPPVLLPHARLLQIVKLCPAEGSIRLRMNATTCIVEAGTGRWTLPVAAAEGYPTWTMRAPRAMPRIPGDQFARAVNAVIYACDHKAYRYAIGGVLLHSEGEVFSVVATDGKRLSVARCEHDLAVDDLSALIPKSAATILKEAAKGAEVIQLELTPSELVATTETMTVAVRLLEGQYPDWQKLVPSRESATTVVDRDALREAVVAAAVVTSEESKGVTVAIQGGGLLLTSRSQQYGEAKVTCEVVEAGTACSFTVNPDYVTEFLAGLDKEDEPHVEIEAEDAESAVILRCGDSLCVVMPLAS